MSAVTGGTQKARAPRWPAGFVPKLAALCRAVEELYRLVQVRLTVDGGTAAASGGGDGQEVHIRVGGGGGVVEAPEINLKLWLKKHAANQWYVTAGKVDDTDVKWGGTGGSDLDDESPQIFSTSNAWVWLAIEFDMTFEQGWFVGAELVGAYVTYGASIPANDPTGGAFYAELGRVVGGAITRNTMGYSLYSMLRDNSSISASNVAFALGRVA